MADDLVSKEVYVDEVNNLLEWITRFTPNELEFFGEIIHNYRHSFNKTELELSEKLSSCLTKLMAVNYHKTELSKASKRNINFSKKFMKKFNFRGIGYSYTPLDMIFEFEAFVLQTQAFLSIFSTVVGIYFGQRPSNIKRLKKVLSKNESIEANKILEILEKNEWLKDFESNENSKSLRDIVAHYSEVKTTGFFIDKRCGKGKIERPKIGCSGKEDLEEYSEFIYNNLVNLVKESITFLYHNILYDCTK